MAPQGGPEARLSNRKDYGQGTARVSARSRLEGWVAAEAGARGVWASLFHVGEQGRARPEAAEQAVHLPACDESQWSREPDGVSCHERRGKGPRLIRVSCGLEDVGDTKADVLQALSCFYGVFHKQETPIAYRIDKINVPGEIGE